MVCGSVWLHIPAVPGSSVDHWSRTIDPWKKGSISATLDSSSNSTWCNVATKNSVHFSEQERYYSVCVERELDIMIRVICSTSICIFGQLVVGPLPVGIWVNAPGALFGEVKLRFAIVVSGTGHKGSFAVNSKGESSGFSNTDTFGISALLPALVSVTPVAAESGHIT